MTYAHFLLYYISDLEIQGLDVVPMEQCNRSKVCRWWLYSELSLFILLSCQAQQLPTIFKFEQICNKIYSVIEEDNFLIFGVKNVTFKPCPVYLTWHIGAIWSPQVPSPGLVTWKCWTKSDWISLSVIKTSLSIHTKKI